MMQGILTLILLIAFIGLCFWAYSDKPKKTFDEASKLPLEEDQDD